MKHILTTIAAVLLVGCATKPSGTGSVSISRLSPPAHNQRDSDGKANSFQ